MKNEIIHHCTVDENGYCDECGQIWDMQFADDLDEANDPQ